MLAAVEEALRLDVSDAAAVLHLFQMPDASERKRHALSLTNEMQQFERPMPLMDEYDCSLIRHRCKQVIQ